MSEGARREGAAPTPRDGGGRGCGSRGLTHTGAVLLHPAHFALAAVSVGRACARLARLIAGWKAEVGGLLRVNPFSGTATRPRSSQRLRTYTPQGKDKTGNRKPQGSQIQFTTEKRIHATHNVPITDKKQSTGLSMPASDRILSKPGLRGNFLGPGKGRHPALQPAYTNGRPRTGPGARGAARTSPRGTPRERQVAFTVVDEGDGRRS